ncbi:MAG: TetR/AcrR family transcriptional regulator [Hyphomicrobiales bacterium]
MSESLGLRTRQKQQRRDRILDAARDLFSERGYAASTIKDIADRAAVSPPTVHKYYGTKQQLLFDLLVEEDNRDVNQLHEKNLPQTGGANPTEATTNLLAEIVDAALERVDEHTWNYALEAFEDRKNITARQKFRSQLSISYNPVEVLLREMKLRGALISDFDVKSARDMLEIINYSLFKMLLGGELSKSDYRSKIQQYVHCLLAGQTQSVSGMSH